MPVHTYINIQKEIVTLARKLIPTHKIHVKNLEKRQYSTQVSQTLHASETTFYQRVRAQRHNSGETEARTPKHKKHSNLRAAPARTPQRRVRVQGRNYAGGSARINACMQETLLLLIRQVLMVTSRLAGWTCLL